MPSPYAILGAMDALRRSREREEQARQAMAHLGLFDNQAMMGMMRMPQAQQPNAPWLVNQTLPPWHQPRGYDRMTRGYEPEQIHEMQGYRQQPPASGMPSGYERMIQGYRPAEVQQMQRYNPVQRQQWGDMEGYMPMSTFDQHVGG